MTSSLTNYDNKAYFGKYDEMYAQNSSIRPLYKQFSKILKKLSIEDLNKMPESASSNIPRSFKLSPTAIVLKFKEFI